MSTQTAKPVRVYEAGDYAGLEAGPWKLYYGYEFARDADDGEVWGFEAKRDGQSVFRLSHDDMATYRGCPDRFECGACLLFGVGLLLQLGLALDGATS